MLKIKAYYQSTSDLQKAEEPYKSVATILDKLYLEGPKGMRALPSHKFENIYVVSCIRDIAEDLSMNQVSFVSRLKSLWSALLNSDRLYSKSFTNYGVPNQYCQGTIFGGVYYVLCRLNSVDKELLRMMTSFVSNYSEALPYFNVFKDAFEHENNMSTMQNSKNNSQNMVALRKQFIKNLTPSIVSTIDWTDATIAFDREVMKEIFWGVEDDNTLKTVVKAIINTWDKLYKARDHRCLEKGAVGSMATSLDPWKFGGVFKESINDFFAALWVERNARNTYATFGMEEQHVLQEDQQTSKQDIFADKTEVDNIGRGNSNDEEKLLRKKLAEVVAEKDVMSTTIDSLKNDLLAFKTRDKKGKDIPLLRAKQIAIFLKAILLEHNSLTNNAKNLAPLVQQFGGWASTTAENALGYEVTQDECDDLAKLFDDYAPKIGNIIRVYPDKFKQVKGKKLQNNLKS